MCEQCLDGYDADIDNAKVRAARRLVRLLDAEHPAGGLLHIVTDDLNVETVHVLWCCGEEQLSADYVDREPTDTELRVRKALLDMTEDERMSALRWDKRLEAR